MIAQLERSDQNQFQLASFRSQGLRDIYRDLSEGKEGATDRLVKMIGNVEHHPNSLGQIDTSQAILRSIDSSIGGLELLPLIEPERALPIIERILVYGLEGRTLEARIQAASKALAGINSPDSAKALPLVNQNLVRLKSKGNEWLDQEEVPFEIQREGVVKSLEEARNACLWKTAGSLRDRLRVILPLTRKGQSFLILDADPKARSIACFDLEGPLSGMDCSYEVFVRMIPGGKEMYEIISYYDDMVCGLVPGKREWRRENYEAGDTLKLIVPQLIYHGINEDDIRRVSSEASLVPGVKQLFEELQDEGWALRIVSTSYRQHAHNIGSQLGLSEGDIYCTKLPLDEWRKYRSSEAGNLVKNFEKKLIGFSPEDFGTKKDQELKEILDRFFWQDVQKTSMGEAMRQMVVMGGARKMWALERVARRLDAYLEQIAFTGDSITDAQAAKGLEASRGLMTACRGNKFIIPFSTVSFAGLDMRDQKPIFDAWYEKGRTGLMEWLGNQPEPSGEFDARRRWLVDLGPEELDEVVAEHSRYRKKMREAAANIG